MADKNDVKLPPVDLVGAVQSLDVLRLALRQLEQAREEIRRLKNRVSASKKRLRERPS